MDTSIRKAWYAASAQPTSPLPARLLKNKIFLSRKSRSLPAAIVLSAFFVPTQGDAETIDTRASNTLCDESVITTSKKKDENKVDWMALGRKQREISGKELLPEHTKKPEQDKVIACTLKKPGAVNSAKPLTPIDSELEDTKAESENRRENAEARENSDSTSNGTNPNEVHKPYSKESLLGFWDDMDMPLRIAFVTFLAAFASLLALGGRFAGRVVISLVRRRCLCNVTASLVTPGHAVNGQIAILGLRGMKFIPAGKEELGRLEKLMSDSTFHDFDVRVKNTQYPVFVDNQTANFASLFFIDALTRRQHKQIVQYSTVEPQFDLWAATTKDARRRNRHIKERRERLNRERKMATAHEKPATA